MNFQTIGFIGLGLIGGSIAKKIKHDHPQVTIYATARHKDTITEAYQEGLIANEQLLPLQAFSCCDLIFLCAPVQMNISYLEELKEIIKPTCYITDVGSTKTQIHEEVIRLGLEYHFIGGHPMTGSEKTGVKNASEQLLKNAYYIITPTAVTPEEDIRQFQDFVASLGSIPLVLDYRNHDFATASISHLPHLIAYALVNLVKESDDEQHTMRTIAAGGFRDITRIASSSPIMWQNICASNKEPILSLLDAYIRELQKVRNDIEADHVKELLDYFQSAKDYRDSMTIPDKTKSNTNI